MPIVPDKKTIEPYVQLKARLPKSIYDEMESYCQWRNDISKSHFLEHALAYVFEQDEDWRIYKNYDASDSCRQQC